MIDGFWTKDNLSLSLSFFMLHCLKCIYSHVIVVGYLSQCATVVSATVAFVHQRALTLSPPLFLPRTTFDRFFPDWEHQSCGYGQALNQSSSRHFGQVVMSIFPAALRAKSVFVASYVPGAVMKRWSVFFTSPVREVLTIIWLCLHDFI